MKKRTAVIAALISFLPMGHPLLIGTGVFLTSTTVIFVLPERTQAESDKYYFEQGMKKYRDSDYYGAISDFTREIQIDPTNSNYYYYRGNAVYELGGYY